MANLVTVSSYPSRIEAEVAKGLLESNGIKSAITADDAGGMEPYPMSNSYGVRLKVSEEDFEKAQEILTKKH